MSIRKKCCCSCGCKTVVKEYVYVDIETLKTSNPGLYEVLKGQGSIVE